MEIDYPPWPELEANTKGRKRGEILVLGASGQGKSMLDHAFIEKLQKMAMEEGVAVVTAEQPKEIKITDHYADTPVIPDLSAHPLGKKTKPKKRRLKRKPGRP